MPAFTREVLLPDGRRADVLRGGAAREPALILHHGTPSDATVWVEWDDVAREHGLQLMAISGPGYAASTRQRGRRVADIAGDVDFVLQRSMRRGSSPLGGRAAVRMPGRAPHCSSSPLAMELTSR